MNLALKVFLYENDVLEGAKMLVWKKWECVCFICWDVKFIFRTGEKEVLYLQTVLETSSYEVPMNIIKVLYE